MPVKRRCKGQKRRKVKKQGGYMLRKGFTLIEIMIVVAIIALLSAVAVPNILRARLNANETAAIANLKTLFASAQSFLAATGDEPTIFNDMSTATPPYIDGSWAGAAAASVVSKGGYDFQYSDGTAANGSFHFSATPTTYGTTGNRSFYVDESGVMFTTDGTADVTADPGHAATSGSAPSASWTAL
jgi:type IV pilus assembly protein PilA